MSFPVGLLHGRIVGVLVRDEERGLDVATVGILSLAVEDLFVERYVVVVDGVVEGDGDHLGHVLVRQVAGYGRTVFRTEAVRQHTDRRVARRCSVGIVVVI